MDPDGDPDRHQNLITWSLGYALPLQEISSKSVHNFFSYLTKRQTDKQTDRSKNITSSSAEVTTLVSGVFRNLKTGEPPSLGVHFRCTFSKVFKI